MFATPLLMSPFCDFLEMSGFEASSRCATNLANFILILPEKIVILLFGKFFKYYLLLPTPSAFQKLVMLFFSYKLL